MTNLVRKIVFIGGGSAYVPLIVDKLDFKSSFCELREIVFIAPTSYKLNAVSEFCNTLLKNKGRYLKITKRQCIDNSIKDADIVFAIFRAGGLRARHLDETMGNDLGVIGQESQGYGGFSSALRNIAVLLEIAPLIRKYAPNALYINITNPSGIMTMAARKMGLNAIGICDVPYAMKNKISNFLGIDTKKLDMEYIGLNHLGWITDLKYEGQSILSEIIKSKKIKELIDIIKQKNIPSVSMNVAFINAINALPSSYLYYYYYRDEIFNLLSKNTISRAQKVMEDNKSLYSYYEKQDIENWPNFFGGERGAYLLGDAISEFLSAYFGNDSMSSHTICIPNQSCLSFLDYDSVIETQAKVSNGGYELTLQDFHPNGHIKSLICSVSEYEAMTVEAGLTGDKSLAFQALASHPLVPTVEVANELLNRNLNTFSDYLPQFD